MSDVSILLSLIYWSFRCQVSKYIIKVKSKVLFQFNLDFNNCACVLLADEGVGGDCLVSCNWCLHNCHKGLQGCSSGEPHKYGQHSRYCVIVTTTGIISPQHCTNPAPHTTTLCTSLTDTIIVTAVVLRNEFLSSPQNIRMAMVPWHDSFQYWCSSSHKILTIHQSVSCRSFA